MMKDEQKTKEQLIDELLELRRRIAELETLETVRKQTEDKIRNLIRVAEHSSRMLMITDSRAIIEYVNPTFTQVTRYTFEEIIGKNAEDLGCQSPEERKEMWGAIKAGGNWQGELQNKKKSDETYWELAQISSITNTDGLINHFVKVAEDITAQRDAASQVSKSESQIANRRNKVLGRNVGVKRYEQNV